MSFTDLPPGATVLSPPKPATSPVYSDLPEGATIQSKPEPSFSDVQPGWRVIPGVTGPEAQPQAPVAASPKPPLPQERQTPVATEPPAAMGTLDELVAGAQRGWYRPGLGAGAKTFGYMLGFGTDEDLAKDIASRQQSYEAAPQSEAIAEGGSGVWDFLDPQYLAAQAGEQLGGLAEMMAAIGAAGLVGGPVGAVGAGIAGSAAQELPNAFNEYLAKQGVDLKNELEVLSALKNPEIREAALNYAATRAGVIGAVSGAAGVVGAKVLPRMFIGTGVGSKIAGGATVMGLGGASEGLGEAGAQLASTGETDARTVAESTFLGLIFGVPEVAMPAVAKGLKVGADRVTGGEPEKPKEDWSWLKFGPDGTPILDEKWAGRLPVDDPKVQRVTQALEAIRSLPDVFTLEDARELMTEKFAETGIPAELQRTLDRAQKIAKYAKSPIQKDFLYSGLGEELISVVQDMDQGVKTPLGKSMVPDVLVSTPLSTTPTRLSVAEARTELAEPVLAIDAISGEFSPAMIDKTAETLGQSGYEFMALPREFTAAADELRAAGLEVEEQAIRTGFAQGSEERLLVKLSRTTGGQDWTVAETNVEAPKGERVDIGSTDSSAFKLSQRLTPETRQLLQDKIKQIGEKFANLFKLKGPVKFEFPPGGDLMHGRYTGRKVELWIDTHGSEAHVFNTLMHELGHVVVWDHFTNASTTTQLAILFDYARFKENAMLGRGESRKQTIRSKGRETVGRILGGETLGWRGRKSRGTSDYQTEYWESFHEWFAENTARWATSRDRPINVVEQFFSSLARKIKRMVERFSKWAGIDMEPTEAVTDFLEAFMLNPEAVADTFAQAQQKSQAESQNALRAMGASSVRAVPQTPQTAVMVGMASKILAGGGPKQQNALKQLKGVAAIADRMNRFYKLMAGLPQIARMNPHLHEVQLYKEDIANAQNEIAAMMNQAVQTLRRGEKLRPKQRLALIDVLDDYVMMTYRTQDEQNRKVKRLPTAQEMQVIFQQYGLETEGQAVFGQMVADYDRMLSRLQDMLVEQAKAITDPLKSLQRLKEVTDQIAAMRKEPYVPLMRYGKYTVTVRNKNGKREDWMPFSIVESKREQARLFKEYQEQYGILGLEVFAGEVVPEATPLIGLPPGLLDSMADKLRLTKAQQALLTDLRFELSPAQSFKHRLQRRSRTPGYSKDFFRSYAQYFLHAANYTTRVKYRDRLMGYIDSLEDRAKVTPGLRPGRKRSQVVGYLSEHFREWNDPSPDFWRVKAVAFHAILGFNIKSAIANLTSIPMATYPFLAHQFGDVRAIAAIGRAMLSRSTYYRKGKLDAATFNAPVTKILAELYKEGTITEALATELAGVAEGRNLIQKALGGTAQRGVQQFLRASAGMFGMAEQANRRMTAAAAAMLALQKPNAQFVQTAVQNNALQYQKLVNSGWDPLHARALVAAKDATEVTQGVYSRWGRAPFMKGKKGAIFMFKGFQQNYLWMLMNYPGTVLRSTLVLGAMGGLMGVPFADDLRDLLAAVGRLAFGKHFDLQNAMREFLVEWTEDPELSDSILFGASRKGFGIGSLMELMGVPFPNVDISSSVGIGQINPVPIMPFLKSSPDSAIADAAKGVAGIPFGLAFSGFEAAQATYQSVAGSNLPLGTALDYAMGDPNVVNAWLKFIPRAVANAGRAFWSASEGGVLSRTGSKVIQFDVEDTDHMAELIGMGLGFNPVRLSQAWDEIAMKQEFITYWDTRRQVLIRQFAESVRRQDGELKAQVIAAIKAFNRELPKEAKLKHINSETLMTSLRERAKARALQEKGIGLKKSDQPITQKIGKQYPGAEVVDQRPVR